MIRFVAALAIAGVTSPGVAEVTRSSDAGFVIDLTTEAPGTPLATWKVLTAPGQWWDPEHTYSGRAENMYLDVQGSGCFCELLDLPKDAIRAAP